MIIKTCLFCLGLELIADEKSREVKEDGEYPEYKHNCRRFKSTPNSYFMRHSLEDDLRMRYRYLNKGDSVSISTQMKVGHFSCWQRYRGAAYCVFSINNLF